MIEAKHNNLARFIFNAYEYRLLKKSFNRFLLLNDNFQVVENKSVIFLPNHFSWWDGFFIDFLIRIAGVNKKFHIIMLEEQLKKYWFFRFLGATGFNPSNPKSIIKLSNFICTLLNSSHNCIVFYPQGEIQYYDEDLKIKQGLKYILMHSPNDIEIFYPFFKIQYFDKKLPDLLCKVYPGLPMETIKNNYQLFIDDFNIKYLDFKQIRVNTNNKRDLFISDND